MTSEGTGTGPGVRSSAVASTAKDQASGVAQTAADQTKEVAREAKEQARSALHRAMDDARSSANEQAGKMSETLRSASRQLSSMADAGDQQSFASTLVREGATAADRVAGRIDAGGVDAVLADIRSFARRNPGAFLFGAAAAGFLAGRLIRNYSQDTMQSNDSEYGYGYAGGSAEMPLPYDELGTSSMGPRTIPETIDLRSDEMETESYGGTT